ncbi:ecto-ADP-ribosyltransferase 5-like isoform X2 [Dendrobates tinctorius]|uniref:ecto-ADP-ribosyltransferase 5-like isoform X2 n=1 Tax=Dendrobates tinctorius TaxID=92724 RepID=UPI003CCA3527
MIGEFVVVVWFAQLLHCTQLCCQALDLNMTSDAFDDQYINCENKMEDEMAKILEEERKYKEFDLMWREATKNWSRGKLNLPSSFKDEYGVAVVLYMMESPYPIYKQLNRNISMAGQSRDYYMQHFHFKALHFYLTRALQVLSGGCAKRFTVFRGSTQSYTVSSELRFGTFTSSSLHKDIAASSGTKSFFTITTCFGVNIADLSEFEEQEILIPGAEKFINITKIGNSYILESSGKMCSYFNCAYLGVSSSDAQTTPLMVVLGIAGTLATRFLTS